MEVHHHPDLHHKPKPWKEYILEGLMIFLAVTMGFFAESLREHISDREREEQYMQLLIEDLKGDRNALQNAISQAAIGAARMDSLVAILDAPASISQRGDDLYYFGRLGPRLGKLSVSTRTFEQLKNSGNFRLISKLEVSNNIMSHYQKMEIIRQLEDIYSIEFDTYKKTAARVFEPAVFIRLETGMGVVRSTDNPALQKDAGQFIKELAIEAIYMNGSRKGIIAFDEQLLKSTSDLLSYLQNNYQQER